MEYDLHDAMTPLKEGGTPNNTFEKEASFSYLYIVVVGMYFFFKKVHTMDPNI